MKRFNHGFFFVTLLFLAIVAGAASAADAVGKVAVLKGDAMRIASTGIRVKLKRGDNLYEGDRVETESRSFAVLKFKDETRFNLGPKAVFKVNEVKTGDDGVFSAEIVRGAFRFVTGLIARNKPRSMRVRTGVVATIGIRGTTVGGEVEGESATIVLLEGEDKKPSAIEVGNEHGSVVINKTGFGTRVPDKHSPPTPPERMTLRTIENLVRNINNIQRISVPRPVIR